MRTKKDRVAVTVLALMLGALGVLGYLFKPVSLYFIAMFGGSYQYEKGFFFLFVGSVVVTAVVLSTVVDRLIFGKKVEKSA